MGTGEGADLAAMLDALPERVARYTRDDLEVRYCNAAKAAEYGLEPAQLLGRRLDEFVTGAELEAMRRHLDELTAEGERRRQVVGPAGDRIEWVDQLVAGPDGDEILSVGRDVTDGEDIRSALRAAEHRFEVAMGEAPIGMALVGLDGRLLRVNPALCDFLGRSEDDLLGLTVIDITHPDDVPRDLEYLQLLYEGGTRQPLSLEKRYLRPDGTVVWGLLKVSMMRDESGRPLYEVGQVVDITDRVQREIDLQRAAKAERDAAHRLRDLDEMKNTFLSAVSHELRTPLTAVQGFAELLQRQHGALSEERSRHVLDRLLHNAERLGELLSDLLDIDRLTSGRTFEPSLVTSPLAPLVRRAITEADPGDRAVTMDLSPVELPVDPAKIERVAQNLFANAVRHTPRGTPVRVSVRPDGAGARLTVEDEGPGVPDELKRSIFEPFTMGDSVATKVGGTGVGLAIVSGFVELHGGSVWVEDRPGGGSAFQVWLPSTPPGGALPGDGWAGGGAAS